MTRHFEFTGRGLAEDPLGSRITWFDAKGVRRVAVVTGRRGAYRLLTEAGPVDARKVEVIPAGIAYEPPERVLADLFD